MHFTCISCLDSMWRCYYILILFELAVYKLTPLTNPKTREIGRILVEYLEYLGLFFILTYVKVFETERYTSVPNFGSFGQGLLCFISHWPHVDHFLEVKAEYRLLTRGTTEQHKHRRVDLVRTCKRCSIVRVSSAHYAVSVYTYPW
jgi:hypothetical protein